MGRALAIDLGTANTLVYASGRGIVFNEPTVVALNEQTQEVLAFGRQAWQMIGRTPGYVVALRPLRQGAITDFDITERMIRLILQSCGVSRFSRTRVLICVPSAITAVERRAVREAARRAGASAAYLIEQPMAAAIGAGLAVNEPVGSMVIDVGGGTSESAVLSLGGIVALKAIRCGGFDLDSAIQIHVRREHGIAIGERTAEELKLAVGSALPYKGELDAEVRGRDVMTGMPKVVVLSPAEVREAIEEQLHQMLPPSWRRTSSPMEFTYLVVGHCCQAWQRGFRTRPRCRCGPWRCLSNAWLSGQVVVWILWHRCATCSLLTIETIDQAIQLCLVSRSVNSDCCDWGLSNGRRFKLSNERRFNRRARVPLPPGVPASLDLPGTFVDRPQLRGHRKLPMPQRRVCE